MACRKVRLEMHVVRIRLNAPNEAREAGILSTDAQDRAGRFVFELHRRRFVFGRSALRRILGAYLGVDPTFVVFS